MKNIDSMLFSAKNINVQFLLDEITTIEIQNQKLKKTRRMCNERHAETSVAGSR